MRNSFVRKFSIVFLTCNDSADDVDDSASLLHTEVSSWTTANLMVSKCDHSFHKVPKLIFIDFAYDNRET